MDFGTSCCGGRSGTRVVGELLDGRWDDERRSASGDCCLLLGE